VDIQVEKWENVIVPANSSDAKGVEIEGKSALKVDHINTLITKKVGKKD
jgi:hypothetical protein